MNVSGLPPSANVQRPDETGLALRLNQRLAAEVLQVSGDRAVLALEGVRVVARLTSAEQAAGLSERRFAHFIVRDLAGPAITLQWIRPGATRAEGAQGQVPQLLPQLLQGAGLPVEPPTLAIARALLAQGLPVTSELVEALQKALTLAYGAYSPAAQGEAAGQAGWGPAAAQAAATLSALGLPLTAGTLALAASQLPPLADLISGLKAQLQTLLKKRPAPRLAERAQKALASLDGLAVDCSESTEILVEKLRGALAVLGRSLERQLAQKASRENIDPFWMALAGLRRELAGGEFGPVREAVDRFLDGVRWSQLLNCEPEFEPVRGYWLRLELPLTFGPGGASPSKARLNIACRPDSHPPAIDPAHTRLVVQVELGPGEVVQMDLSVVDQRVGAQVTASSSELRQRAQSEIPGLQAGLERLGYVLQNVSCQTSELCPAGGWEGMPGAAPISAYADGQEICLQV